ncbi:MAG: hypothetical protein P4L33_14600 [Capsulimonadaceae bacterium]|nr:hypothetical protein [Capsulimonadaceae bacterium]
MKEANHLPESVCAVLWSYDTDRIDVDAHKKLIVAQVLNFGTEDAINWVFKQYGQDEVTRLANEIPLGQWDKKSLSLWSLVLGIAPMTRAQRMGII